MSDGKSISVAEFYNTRFDEFGVSIKSTGWGSIESQRLRFQVLFRGINPKGKTILDVGCGLGGLLPFLQEATNGDFTYIGIDVADKLVYAAAELHGGRNRKFLVGDVFSAASAYPLSPDISVLSGALTYNAPGIERYALDTMEKMYEISKEAACLNFLSSYVDYELEKNKHYSPESVFEEAKKISKRVNLYHDYPLYEFTVQLFKPLRVYAKEKEPQ